MGNPTPSELFLKEAERVFCHFNHFLFDGKISLPLIGTVLDRRVGIKFCIDIDGRSHLTLGHDAFGLNEEDFLGDFLHEMVHARNASLKITDVTSNQYHNSEFLSEALRIGLHVARQKTRNWGYTSISPRKDGLDSRYPSPEAATKLQDVIRLLNFNVEILADCHAFVTQKQERPKQFLLKWICDCPSPHNSIRSGRRPNGPHAPKLRCESCGSLLRPETETA